MKNKVNIMFILIIFSVLSLGFIKTLIMPKSINYIENRTAYKYPKFNLASFKKGTYQDDIEKALSDQIPLSNKMKLANKTIALLTKINYFKLFSNSHYNNIGGMYLYNDNLLYGYTADIPEAINEHIANFNMAQKNIDLDFYLYYIEKDSDINFDNNSKLNLFEYLKKNLDSRIISSKFTINNFEDFRKYFYKTDHHWNNKGSYKAYTELVKLLTNDEPLEYKEEVCQKDILSGSKAATVGGTFLFKENFCAYKIPLKDHKVYINNVENDNYTIKDDFFNTKLSSISYGDFYGNDYGLLELDYNEPEKENLLIIGESYDNAINDLIASHFNKTYNVDLRHYKDGVGKEFNLKEFIKEKDIDKVLLIGNINYFITDTFLLKGVN